MPVPEPGCFTAHWHMDIGAIAVVSGPDAGRIINLGATSDATIGRAAELRIDDPRCEVVHAQFDRAGGTKTFQFGQHCLVDQMWFANIVGQRAAQFFIRGAQHLVGLAQALQVKIKRGHIHSWLRRWCRCRDRYGLGGLKLLTVGFVQLAHPFFKLGIGQLFFVQRILQARHFGWVDPRLGGFWRYRVCRALFEPGDPLRNPVQRRRDAML